MFAEGALVRQGDPLFAIDARPYEAEVARAEAALEQARTRESLSRMELERVAPAPSQPQHEGPR